MRCAKKFNGTEQTAIWSDESVGVVVSGATAGQPSVVSATIDETNRAGHDGEVWVIVRWRNTVAESNHGEHNEDTSVDVNDVNSTWSMVTEAITIWYSVDVAESELEGNPATMYVSMAVETQVTVHTMDGNLI